MLLLLFQLDLEGGTIPLQPSPGFTATVAPRRFASVVPVRSFASVVSPRFFALTAGPYMPAAPQLSEMDVGEETIVGAGIDLAPWPPPGATIATIVSVTVQNKYPPSGGPFVSLVGYAQVGTIPPTPPFRGTGTANTSVLQQWRGVAVGVASIIFTVIPSVGGTLIVTAYQPGGTAGLMTDEEHETLCWSLVCLVVFLVTVDLIVRHPDWFN